MPRKRKHHFCAICTLPATAKLRDLWLCGLHYEHEITAWWEQQITMLAALGRTRDPQSRLPPICPTCGAARTWGATLTTLAELPVAVCLPCELDRPLYRPGDDHTQDAIYRAYYDRWSAEHFAAPAILQGEPQ